MSDAAVAAPVPEKGDLEAAGLANKPSKLVPIALGLNSLLLVVVLVKLFLLPAPAAAPAEAKHEEGGAPKAEHAVAPPGLGPTVKLPEFVVHLRNPEAERYARLSFELEVGVELDKDKLTAHMPKIRELFLAYLSDCTMEDLRGSEGIERTKKDLLNRLAQAIPGSPVRGVFVTDIVVQ